MTLREVASMVWKKTAIRVASRRDRILFDLSCGHATKAARCFGGGGNGMENHDQKCEGGSKEGEFHD
jgi:hypothetical protein